MSETTAKFRKYAKSAWCLETDQSYEHGDKVIVTTKYGKEVSISIWKFLFEKNGTKYYSYIRDDGMCGKQKHLRNAERYEKRADRKKVESDSYYEKSNKDQDFLSLGEPIKVGHHSEKRHRRIIEQANRNMSKCVEASKDAENLKERAENAKFAADDKIYLDTPECLEQLRLKLGELEARRDSIKAHNKASKDKTPRFVLSNLGAKIRATKKNLSIAENLWDLKARESNNA